MDLYRQEILDHYKHPHNFGHLSKPQAKATLYNTACGDVVTIELNIGKMKGKDVVQDIRFSGEGCAISKSSASILTDSVKGMGLFSILSMKPEKVYAFFGSNLTPARVKCALLPLETIQKAILEWQTPSKV